MERKGPGLIAYRYVCVILFLRERLYRRDKDIISLPPNDFVVNNVSTPMVRQWGLIIELAAFNRSNRG